MHSMFAFPSSTTLSYPFSITLPYVTIITQSTINTYINTLLFWVFFYAHYPKRIKESIESSVQSKPRPPHHPVATLERTGEHRLFEYSKSIKNGFWLAVNEESYGPGVSSLLTFNFAVAQTPVICPLNATVQEF